MDTETLGGSEVEECCSSRIRHTWILVNWVSSRVSHCVVAVSDEYELSRFQLVPSAKAS